MKKNRLFIVYLMMFVIISSFSVITVEAVSDIDDSIEKCLTVHFYTQKVGVDTPISGADIAVTKVADMYVKNGNLCFNSVSDVYKNTDFNNLSTQKSVEFAAFAANIKHDYDFVATTDKNGNAVFNVKDNGIYLIEEIKANGMALDYELIEPYIIIVPYTNNHMSEWQYDVLSEPKTAIVDTDISYDNSDVSVIIEPSEPSVSQSGDTVLTGDRSDNVIVFVCLGFLSVLLIICLVPDNKNNKKGGC